MCVWMREIMHVLSVCASVAEPVEKLGAEDVTLAGITTSFAATNGNTTKCLVDNSLPPQLEDVCR